VPTPRRFLPSLAVGLSGIVLGLLAFGTPFLPGRAGFVVLGFLLVAYGVLQNFTGFATRDSGTSGSWLARGGLSVLTGVLLLVMPKLSFAALAVLLGLSWVVDGLSAAFAAARSRDADWHWTVLDGIVSVAVGLAIAAQWPVSGLVSVGVIVGVRYVSAGWAQLVRAVHGTSSDSPAGVPPDPPYVVSLRTRLAAEEVELGRNDRRWVLIFLITFFAIHVARMDVDMTAVGLLSPAGAVAGDVAIAIAFAYGLFAPVSAAYRTLTRPLERRAWSWYLPGEGLTPRAGMTAGAVGGWLRRRARTAAREDRARGSPTAAFGWGLRKGMPATAVLLAVTPLWGINWVFDTETWVTGAWELWAEHRTETWRTEMVSAVRREAGDASRGPDFFRVTPDGVAGAADFRFVVIGDTGEGDASQHCLRDGLWKLGREPDVKFLVVSSDVIYPSGAMRHYEPKFYLPFKGFGKPIYAVPGNHDWYDALDAFTANFFEPDAARVALRARGEADGKLTTTTEARIDKMIGEAGRLREQYGVSVAHQRAPYFELHGDAFSLIVVDTGISRRVDDDQFFWLEAALERAAGKFKMVILGHPVYAAGKFLATDDEFARIYSRIKAHNVDVVMAGDTHDFEFYREPARDGMRPTDHFVNGGGGAYLSIGTALTWPKVPPVPVCGTYPRADELTAALDTRTAQWKRPMWWWVKRLGAWPATPETVAAGFDYDRAPFFQSFVEVRVEGSAGRVRLWVHGANGRLRWRDLMLHGDAIPAGQTAEDFVEFTYPLRVKVGR
jgi:uncharacterized membrane protein HdeD (DUF308 family)